MARQRSFACNVENLAESGENLDVNADSAIHTVYCTGLVM